MTDPLEIITAGQLVTYVGAGLADDARTALLVTLANAEVTDHWPGAATHTGDIPAKVTAIALEVAARPARNPKGLASWTRSVDDGSRTERLPDSAARAGVYVTEAEAADLAAVAATVVRRPRVGSIRTRPGW